jgi:hypothetical protein
MDDTRRGTLGLFIHACIYTYRPRTGGRWPGAIAWSDGVTERIESLRAARSPSETAIRARFDAVSAYPSPSSGPNPADAIFAAVKRFCLKTVDLASAQAENRKNLGIGTLVFAAFSARGEAAGCWPGAGAYPAPMSLSPQRRPPCRMT